MLQSPLGRHYNPLMRSLVHQALVESGAASPMTARAGIDVADPWAAIEACFDRGWTDGLPVVPPTEALVDAMLAAGPWPAGEVLLHEPVRDRSVTAEKAAINAVMAGCRPEYFPVVGAALSAIGDPEFMFHGPATSTGGSALMVIVNGPIAARLGLNAGREPVRAGYRANATIGRTLRLVLLNCLECRPGVLDKSTQGWPGKYSLCFAEDEAASPWEPLSVSRGVPVGRSAVTVYAAESGHNVLSHGTGDPERLLTCFADAMAGLGSLSPGRSVIVFAPEHASHVGAPGGRARACSSGSTTTRGARSPTSSAAARSSPLSTTIRTCGLDLSRLARGAARSASRARRRRAHRRRR